MDRGEHTLASCKHMEDMMLQIRTYFYYFFQLLCCHSSVFGMRAARVLACTGTASCSCARLQGGAQARVMGALAARMHGQEIECEEGVGGRGGVLKLLVLVAGGDREGGVGRMGCREG